MDWLGCIQGEVGRVGEEGRDAFEGGAPVQHLTRLQNGRRNSHYLHTLLPVHGVYVKCDPLIHIICLWKNNIKMLECCNDIHCPILNHSPSSSGIQVAPHINYFSSVDTKRHYCLSNAQIPSQFTVLSSVIEKLSLSSQPSQIYNTFQNLVKQSQESQNSTLTWSQSRNECQKRKDISIFDISLARLKK